MLFLGDSKGESHRTLPGYVLPQGTTVVSLCSGAPLDKAYTSRHKLICNYEPAKIAPSPWAGFFF